MAIDFSAWNEQFGGDEAVKALHDAEQNGDFSELPDGTYVCRIEKLELGESKKHQPMIKGMFRITQGEHKKQCLFYNQVFCRNASGNAFSIKKGLDFLRSLQIFDDAEVDFDGDYAKFNDLLLDMAEEAETAGLTFEIFKCKDGDFTRLEITDVYE
jgi:hypothetical protein